MDCDCNNFYRLLFASELGTGRGGYLSIYIHVNIFCGVRFFIRPDHMFTDAHDGSLRLGLVYIGVLVCVQLDVVFKSICVPVFDVPCKGMRRSDGIRNVV